MRLILIISSGLLLLFTFVWLLIDSISNSQKIPPATKNQLEIKKKEPFGIRNWRQLKPKEAEIWFFGHSGFAVRTKNNLLVFDYWIWRPADIDTTGLFAGIIESKEIEPLNVYMFVSHHHQDHFDPLVFLELQRQVKNIQWIMTPETFDLIKADTLKRENVTVIKAHQMKQLDLIRIQTLKATDAGLAYLIETDGLTIYHAGDHAIWSDETKGDYKSELNRLKGKPIDIAFVPVDARLREMDFAGATYFVRRFEPKIVFPMHRLGEDFVEGNVFCDAVEKATVRTKPFRIMKRGQYFTYSMAKLN